MDNISTPDSATKKSNAIEKLKFEVSQEMGIKPKVKNKKK